MKLCKKKMAILVTVLCLMVVMVFVLCSFTLPSFSGSPLLFSYTEQFTVSDFENLCSIVDLQFLCGTLNGFRPIAIGTVSPDNEHMSIYLYCTKVGYDFTVRVSSSMVFTTDGGLFRLRLDSTGFCYWETFSGTVGANRILGYYPSSNSTTWTLSAYYSFSSSSQGHDAFIDVKNYWIDFYERLLFDAPNEIESAYNHGYTNGYLTGNADGYRNGYDEGVDYGYNVAYPQGYDSGLADGYQTGFADGLETGYRNGYTQGDIDGYESGFDEGYSEGYDEGYATAERETVIEYVEPVEISVGSIISGISSVPDNILNGTFDFELFGINVYGLLKVIIILFVISAVVVFVIKRSA